MNPAEVTLKDVYRTIAQGSLMPNWCSGDPDCDCLVGSNMQDVMNGIFCVAEQRMEDYFSELTIAGVLGQITRSDAR